MALRLLQEWRPLNYTQELVAEARQKDGRIVLRGVLQRADTLNQNGRIYPKVILEREVRNYQKFIKERRSIGELDHPSSSVVELKNGSHVITEAYMQGDDVYGAIEVLNKLPMGKILEGYIEHNIKVGISSRGVGSTQNEGGHQMVNDDFQLICWDIVSEPSTSGAFMMAEGHIIYDANGLPIIGFPRNTDRDNRIINLIDGIMRK
jgi:hypothetical protein